MMHFQSFTCFSSRCTKFFISKFLTETKAIACKAEIIFYLFPLAVCACCNANVYGQTITSIESRCINTGAIIVSGTVGAGAPYQLSVTSYPVQYSPGPAHIAQSLPDTIAALFPGLYTIKIVDGAGVVFTYPAINIPGDYVLGTNDYLPVSTPVTNCASPNGTIQGAMTNRRSPYSYKIVSGPAQIGGTNSSGTFTGLPAGDYTVQAADSCQNIQTRDVTIDGYPTSFVIDSAHVKFINCTTYSLDSVWLNPPLPGVVHYDVVNYDNSGGSVVRVTSNVLPVSFALYSKTDLLNGRVKIKVYNDCGDAMFYTPLKYSNIQRRDTITSGIINRVTCDSFSLESLVAQPVLTAGTIVTVLNLRTGEVYHSTLPIGINALKSDITSGNIVISVADSCNNIISTNKIRYVNNDWSFVQNMQFNCDGTVVVNNLVFSGLVSSPYVIKVKAFFKDAAGNADSTSEQIITSFPYTITGITGNPNPITIRIEVTDGCGEVQRKTLSRSFIAVAGKYELIDCNVTGFLTSVLGLYDLPITYSISPPAGTVPNTNGYFELPQGAYTITATDTCGKVATTGINLNRSWQLQPVTQGRSCITGYVTDTLSVPRKSVGSLTVKQFAGGMPVNASSLLLNTRVFVSTANACLECKDSSTTLEKIYFDSTFPSQAYTYLVTDSCGNSDTVSVVNSSGKQPFYHHSFSKTRCANGSNIYANWHDDGESSNRIAVTLFDSAHHQLFQLNAENTNIDAHPDGQLIWQNAATAKYTVEYSFAKCPQVIIDTVIVKDYVQPIVTGANSFATCNSTGEAVILTASGGVPPYTYEIINTSPGNYNFPPQANAVFTLPASQSFATVRVIDSCLNSAIVTVAITRVARPVIHANPSPLSTCILPLDIILFTDSLFEGATFEWRKITGANAGETVISNRPSLNVLYYSIADTGTYKVSVSIPGTCFDTSATFSLNNVAINCIGLPVRIANFTATATGHTVILTWLVAEQINISNYIVEWSTDGQHFQPIGSLPATNTSNYSLIHKKPFDGINYYRLKIVERDGSFFYSRITTAHIDLSPDVSVKPNPFANSIDVVINLLQKSRIAIQVYDMAGRKVYQNMVNGLTGSNLFSINNLDNIARGIYVIIIKGDGFLIRRKILKD